MLLGLYFQDQQQISMVWQGAWQLEICIAVHDRPPSSLKIRNKSMEAEIWKITWK